MVHYLTATEGKQVREGNSNETTYPVPLREQILRPKGEPKEKTFRERCERFRDEQVKDTRLAKEYRRHHKYDDRICASRQPDTAGELLFYRQLWREANDQHRRLDRDRE